MIFHFDSRKQIVKAQEGDKQHDIPIRPPDTIMSPYRWLALYAWLGVLLWLVVGFFAFLYGDEDWDAAKSFFFAINVGLGVGWSRPHVEETQTYYFTSGFALVGTSLVMTTLSLLVNHFLEGNGRSYKEIVAKAKEDKVRCSPGMSTCPRGTDQRRRWTRHP